MSCHNDAQEIQDIWNVTKEEIIVSIFTASSPRKVQHTVLKIEALRSSETSVDYIYNSTGCNTPKDLNLQQIKYRSYASRIWYPDTA
jgi:hypothetical protein